MAWSWVGAQLSGMVAGEFKKLNTNEFADIALARTLANFGNLSGTWTTDADVLAVVLAASNTNMCAYSGPAINLDTGQVRFRGGGHTDGGDGTIFEFNPATSFAWSIGHKSGRYQTTAPTVTCNITAITAGTPPRLTVDADIALTGDQGAITSTTDADGTYQLVRVDATHVDLYNLDGTYSATYTAFAGGSLTDSTGTLTITYNPQGSSSNYYFYTNADGAQMPPCMHTYHWKWIGDNRYCLSGNFVKDANSRPPNRIWVLDEDASTEVYRSYHDVSGSEPTADAQTNFGGPWYNGPCAYDTVKGRLYFFSSEASLKNFNYRVGAWEVGQGADSDFQRVYSLEFDGSSGALEGADCCSLPQVGDGTKRAIFAFHSTTEFNYCLDLEGTEVMSVNSFSDGTIFNTDMADLLAIGVCYDDLNDEIIYWGGGATIGAITTSATLSAWTTAEITPATPTGDLPSRTGYPTNGCCAVAKIPEKDAYLLCRGLEVWLYARTDQGTESTTYTVTITDEIGVSEVQSNSSFRNRLSVDEFLLSEINSLSSLRNSMSGEDISIEEILSVASYRGVVATDNVQVFEFLFKKLYLDRVSSVELTEEQVKELRLNRDDYISITETTSASIIRVASEIISVAITENISINELVTSSILRNSVLQEQLEISDVVVGGVVRNRILQNFIDIMEVVRTSIVRNRLSSEDISVTEDMVRLLWVFRVLTDQIDVSDSEVAQIIRFLSALIKIRMSLQDSAAEMDVLLDGDVDMDIQNPDIQFDME